MRSSQNKRWNNRQTGGQNKRLEGSREHNPLKRFHESNCPDVKVRGPAALVAEKYLQLVRDAHVSGDLITGESYEAARELRGPPRAAVCAQTIAEKQGRL